MVEIPQDSNEGEDSFSDETSENSSLIRFKHALSRRAADILIEKIYAELVPEYQEQGISLHFNPMFNKYDNLIGFEFTVPLSSNIKTEVTSQLNSLINQILIKLENQREKNQTHSSSKAPISFTEVLGTYRVKVIYAIIPVLVTIVATTFLAWTAKIKAELDINVAPFPDETNAGQILLNGLIPVVISAALITVIYLLVKKFGMIVFKILMGVVIFLYSWYGMIFFISVFFQIYMESPPSWLPDWLLFSDNVVNISFTIIFYASIVFFLALAVLFFTNRLKLKQRNAIVLFYSIFMGSIFGISFPTWTTFSLAIFLSIWDLIAVFKGPLGKIGAIIQNNQVELQKRMEEMLDSGKVGVDQVANYSQFVALQAEDDKKELDYKEIEIELGSGDLIFYSALVANVFVNYGSWFLAIMVIVGVIAGAATTLYYLLTKKRMLPALPFSMLFGIILFFIGRLIQILFLS